MATKRGERYLEQACSVTAEISDLRRRERTLARRRRILWLRASREGVTYRDMSLDCGTSPSVVEREIRRARAEVEDRDPSLAARQPRRRPAEI